MYVAMKTTWQVMCKYVKIISSCFRILYSILYSIHNHNNMIFQYVTLKAIWRFQKHLTFTEKNWKKWSQGKLSWNHEMANPFNLRLAQCNQPKGKFIWVIQQQSTVMSSLKLQQFVLFLEKANGFQNNKTKSRQYTNYWKIIKTQIIRSTLLRFTKVSVINHSIIVSQQFCHYQYYDSNSIVISKSSFFEAFAIIGYLTKRLNWYYSINFQYFLVKVKQIRVLPILDLQ